MSLEGARSETLQRRGWQAVLVLSQVSGSYAPASSSTYAAGRLKPPGGSLKFRDYRRVQLVGAPGERPGAHAPTGQGAQ